jgi:hypothetical protein
MSLTRMREQQGKRADAHELLVLEGFDTADLQATTTVLEELA